MNKKLINCQNKIKWLRGLNRICYKDGVVIGGIFFYNSGTGDVRRVRHNKQGKLTLGNVINKQGRNYFQIKIIGTDSYIYQHIIAAVALGLYDDIEDEAIEKMQVNHKNGNGLDNRKENLEVVTRSHNVLHAKAMKKLKQRGIWNENLIMTAQAAVYMLQHQIIEEYSLEQMLRAGLVKLIA